VRSAKTNELVVNWLTAASNLVEVMLLANKLYWLRIFSVINVVGSINSKLLPSASILVPNTVPVWCWRTRAISARNSTQWSAVIIRLVETGVEVMACP